MKLNELTLEALLAEISSTYEKLRTEHEAYAKEAIRRHESGFHPSTSLKPSIAHAWDSGFIHGLKWVLNKLGRRIDE